MLGVGGEELSVIAFPRAARIRNRLQCWRLASGWVKGTEMPRWSDPTARPLADSRGGANGIPPASNLLGL